MSKRTLKVRNALTGKVREVVLPGKPATKQKPAAKKTTAKDVKVELKPDVAGFSDALKNAAGGEGVGSDNG